MFNLGDVFWQTIRKHLGHLNKRIMTYKSLRGDGHLTQNQNDAIIADDFMVAEIFREIFVNIVPKSHPVWIWRHWPAQLVSRWIKESYHDTINHVDLHTFNPEVVITSLNPRQASVCHGVRGIYSRIAYVRGNFCSDLSNFEWINDKNSFPSDEKFADVSSMIKERGHLNRETTLKTSSNN